MKNILVAKDLHPMQQDAVRLLSRPDIVVRASGEEILKLHLEKNASLIVTHPALPGMACKTVVDVLRRGQTLKKVSILLLCENDSRQQDVARSCNVNAVLTLPVDTAKDMFSPDEKVRKKAVEKLQDIKTKASGEVHSSALKKINQVVEHPAGHFGLQHLVSGMAGSFGGEN